MTYDLQVVPPPNNPSWAETFIWQQLIMQMKSFATLPQASIHSDGSYNPGALGQLMQDVNTAAWNRLGQSEPYFPRQLLFVEAYTASPLHIKSLQHYSDGPKTEFFSALVHGGSFVPGDTMSDYEMERLWLSQYDLTIAPTRWAADQQGNAHPHVPVEVASWPAAPDIHTKQAAGLKPRAERRYAIINPHRLVPEKGYGLWNDFRDIPGPLRKTTPRELQVTREGYLNLLSESKAVFAASEWETFGIAVMEGMALGCCPVLNHHPVYEELYEQSNVHWHNGSLASLREAVDTTEGCELEHFTLTQIDSMDRVLRIAEIASGGN